MLFLCLLPLLFSATAVERSEIRSKICVLCGRRGGSEAKSARRSAAPFGRRGRWFRHFSGTLNRQYRFSKMLILFQNCLFHGIGTIKVHTMFPSNSITDNNLTAHVNQERVKFCKTVKSLKTKDLSLISRTNKPCFIDTKPHLPATLGRLSLTCASTMLSTARCGNLLQQTGTQDHFHIF